MQRVRDRLRKSPYLPKERHRLASAGLVTLRNELSRDVRSLSLSFCIFSHSWFYLRLYSRSGRNTRAITCRYWSLIGAPDPSVDMPIIGLPRHQPTPARLVRCCTPNFLLSSIRVDPSRIWNMRTLVVSHARGKRGSFPRPVYR
ncbi:hypothetical protein ACFW04_006815 [Cataglyphis niger]